MTISVPHPAYAKSTRQLLVSSQIYFFNIIYIHPEMHKSVKNIVYYKFETVFQLSCGNGRM